MGPGPGRAPEPQWLRQVMAAVLRADRRLCEAGAPGGCSRDRGVLRICLKLILLTVKVVCRVGCRGNVVDCSFRNWLILLAVMFVCTGAAAGPGCAPLGARFVSPGGYLEGAPLRAGRRPRGGCMLRLLRRSPSPRPSPCRAAAAAACMLCLLKVAPESLLRLSILVAVLSHSHHPGCAVTWSSLCSSPPGSSLAAILYAFLYMAGLYSVVFVALRKSEKVKIIGFR